MSFSTKILIFLTLIAIDFARADLPNNAANDKKHYVNGEHQSSYDHESFLGEEAASFDQLTPEESRKRLSIIVDKIDRNNDTEISFDELKRWLYYTQSKYLLNDADTQWRNHNPTGEKHITWAEYRKSYYGLDNDADAEGMDMKSDGKYSYTKMINKDKKRWVKADKNNNGLLDRHEFGDFLHPEESEHMKEIVVEETIADMDMDNDSNITMVEYIREIYHDLDVKNDEELPEWVQHEKEQFVKFRDLDGNGVMDYNEVREWIYPSEYNPQESEAKHLIFEADSNGDGKLSKQEILEKYDLFVGSQATDFGEALLKHDEF